MKAPASFFTVAAISVAAILVSACSSAPQSKSIRFVPAVQPEVSPLDYRVLYSFGTAPDGNYPVAGLIDVSGTLYGTTFEGGKNPYGCSSTNCGTVFSITTGGTEKVLHSFGRVGDGTAPSRV